MATGANMPKRIQRKRTKGWKMPEGAVYVGRPTIFGNPFYPMFRDDRAYRLEAVGRFRAWLEGHLTQHVTASRPSPQQIAQLRGKDLACWCALDQPCHADVLLELANS